MNILMHKRILTCPLFIKQDNSIRHAQSITKKIYFSFIKSNKDLISF